MTSGRRQQCVDALRVGAEKALEVATRLDDGEETWDDLAADAEWARDQIGAAEEMLAECIDEDAFAGNDDSPQEGA